MASLNPGSVAGGSGAQYFIGEFDGKQFTADSIFDPSTPPPGGVFQAFESANTWSKPNQVGDQGYVVCSWVLRFRIRTGPDMTLADQTGPWHYTSVSALADQTTEICPAQ